MSLSLDDRPTGVTAHEPWAGLLTTIADETRVGADGFCLGADVALTQALYERYYQHHATPHLYRGPDDAAPRATPADVAFGRRLTAALVRVPAERQTTSDGWRVVTGVLGPAHRVDQASVHLHLLPATAPEVFARVVRALDALGLPFTAQVLDSPLAFGRPDSAVVTVARELLPTAVRVAVGERCRATSPFGRSVPAFTRPVLPGVAVADVPAGGGCFGWARCRTIAEALFGAGPEADPPTRRSAVRAALTAEGLDLRALHLNPGQPDFPLGRL